jgi:3'-5' exoribonuclease
VASHHGEYADGSPRRPKTAEAFILNILGDMDAEVKKLGW